MMEDFNPDLVGRCQECYYEVSDGLPMCVEHDMDERSAAIRAFARHADYIMYQPGRLLVTRKQPQGGPGITISLLPSVRSFSYTFDKDGIDFVTCRQVFLRAAQFRYQGLGNPVFVYYNEPRDLNKFINFLESCEEPSV